MSRIDEALRRATVGEPDIRPAPIPLESYPIERDNGHAPEVENAAMHVRSKVTAPRTVGRNPFTAFSESVDGKVVVDHEVSHVSVEQYRKLANVLHQLQAERNLKSLMITSALPREGKTLTSTNLALTLSESYGRRVLLVDADLRRPSIHEVFRLPNETGLRDGLRADASGLPLIDVSSRLSVLPGGRPDPDPMAGLVSNRMRRLLEEASQRFDWILLDTPPVGLIPDASVLASLADGVVLVVGAASTDYRHVCRAVAEIGSERILGVVLNRVDEASMHTQEYYRRYYSSESLSQG
jgi:capsular exopolysaccharide synthesis family protein